MKVVNSVMISVGFIGIMLSGCSQEPPKCSDENTLSLVKQIVSEQAYIDNITDTEVNEVFKIDYPRASQYDEKIKKYTCDAKLMFAEYELPIVYESQLDDRNEHIVSVDGIAPADLLLIKQKITEELSNKRAKSAKPATVSPQLQPMNIIGKWDGRMHDADGGVSMEISAIANGYDVSLGAGSVECAGEIQGQGVLKGNTMLVTQKEGEEPCKINIVFDQDTAVLTEEDCLYYHGMACDFSSTLSKQ